MSRAAIEFVTKVLIGDYLRLIKGIILEALVQARSDRGRKPCFLATTESQRCGKNVKLSFRTKALFLF